MTDTRRLVAHLDATFGACLSGLGATIDQLHEWTGEYPATCVGAGPDTSAATPNDQHEHERVSLTKVEADALAPDQAKRAIARCYQIVDQLVSETGSLGKLLGGGQIPLPVERLAPRLAYVQWQISQATTPPIPAQGTRHLVAAARLANELHGIVHTYRPPAKVSGAPAGGCMSHARAGIWEAVDDRYRRHDLCRRCGDFKHQFAQLPPPKLVKMADVHGWRWARSPSTLARFAIKARRAKT